MDAIVKRLMENKKVSMKINDPDHNIVNLIKYISTLAESGHSFKVIVDPKNDSEKAFWIDGDGSDKIYDINIEKQDNTSTSKRVSEAYKLRYS